MRAPAAYGLALLALAFPALAEPLAVPSGQTVTLAEVLSDENPGALWVRFRFLAPEIARENGKVAPDEAAAQSLVAEAVSGFERHGQLFAELLQAPA